jgi:4-hydroxybenzoate polyprenyltransferase
MLRALIKSMRLKQWPKNAFVLAGVVFDRQLLHPQAVLRSFSAFLLFCLLSSSVYLINDIMDVEADRRHPTKRLRPIAAGKLPIPIAAVAAGVLVVFSVGVSFYLSFYLGLIGFAYFLVNLLYSSYLKHIALIDVMVLASGFVLRVAAGVTVIQVERFSPWLYVVTTLLALYIGLGKRRAELSQLASEAASTRRVLDGYSLDFLDQLITIVSSATIVAYSLYTFSAPNVPENHTMMLTIPFVIYGVFRYLYLIKVKNAGSVPEELLMTDHHLQATIGLWGVAVLLVFYFS